VVGAASAVDRRLTARPRSESQDRQVATSGVDAPDLPGADLLASR